MFLPLQPLLWLLCLKWPLLQFQRLLLPQFRLPPLHLPLLLLLLLQLHLPFLLLLPHQLHLLSKRGLQMLRRARVSLSRTTWQQSTTKHSSREPRRRLLTTLEEA